MKVSKEYDLQYPTLIMARPHNQLKKRDINPYQVSKSQPIVFQSYGYRGQPSFPYAA